ncbi:hypothetical protein AcV7_009886 [Taiwanofungus camphoratus]|nr:hypothetical protein AcV7_009886 [Antrodia cinnamomea]
MLASLSPPSLTQSPPLTPPQSTAPDPTRPSPPLSDDSSLFELSFVYELNAQGEYVRVSKGSSNSDTPPTPEPTPPPPQKHPSPDSHKPPSPVPQLHLHPTLLTRSESLPSVSFDPAPAPAPARQFQRVTSGPLLTPASSARTSSGPLSTGGAARKVGGARRVKREDYHETDALLRSQTQTQPQAQAHPQAYTHTIDEKENVRSVLHAHVPLRPTVPIRAIRALKQKASASIDKIIEEHTGEEELPPSSTSINVGSSTGVRPRRSASLSDAAHDHEHGLMPAGYQYQPYSRPGTSLGMTGRGARRVTLEEKIRQEREIALEEGYARRDTEEATEAERRAQAQRQSPSPTHVSSSNIRPSYTHARKDSDTLRSLALSGPSSQSPGSPTAIEFPPRGSPPSRSSASAYASSVPSYTPSSVSSYAPPATSANTNQNTPGLTGTTAVAQNMRHRRSPTAPEAPTTSAGIAPPTGANGAQGKTWAAGDGRESEKEEAGGHARSMPVKQNSQQQAHQQQQAQVATPAPDVRSRNMVVNKKAYARLDMIGKGGSSRVYRVMNGANEIFAIKRVSLDRTDAETMGGYMNEIALLKRLEGNARIIRLVDSELRPGPGGSKGHLMLVMECGEIDLARLLQEQQKEPMDLVWIAYYWKQMLQAVHVIHEEKIVHSDLKPANFVLVRGQLKLIDFGIANAIANDTTNIQRDHQIGTVNYMSPEAIELPDGMRRLKVGRPSDVWSLGCILYQMVYGHPPFQHLSVYQKMKAIPDGSHVIEFPEYSTPTRQLASPSGDKSPPTQRLDHLRMRVPESVIATMRSCLARNPKERAAIPELVEQNWLAMREPELPAPPPPPPPPPPAPPALKEDETIINPYFMRQLLAYGIALGQQGRQMDGELLLQEAERLVAELKSVQAVYP